MDLIEEVHLPSNGEIYKVPVQAENRIRAPRLSDKGIGDISRRNKIQAGVLNKTLLEPLGIDAYDLHTSDFTYLNLRQRMAARGKDMELLLNCQSCDNSQKVTIDLSKIKVTKPKLPLELSYDMKSGEKVELRFFTPHILDDIRSAVESFKEDFPEATQDVSLQETCRAIIVSVDGEKLTYSKMTTFLLNCYEVDLIGIIDKVTSTNFGPVLLQKRKCKKCGADILFSVSPDRG